MENHAITITQAAVLGVVQGLTEFLPISSTAHLRVVPALLHWPDPGTAYSAVIQLGSVIAVLVYFFKDLVEIAAGTFRALKTRDFSGREARLAGAIILGTIPICVIGLIFKKLLQSDDSPLRSLYTIGGAAIFMGVMLALAEKNGRQKRGLDDMGGRDGLLVGLGQAMALIPGCSRSGSTLTVALFLGMKRADAARFSFLLGIPAILLSGLLELKDMLEVGLSGEGMGALAIGLLTSLVVSYAAIAWLIRYLQEHSTWLFVGYRLLFGVVIISLASMGMIK